MVPEALRWYGPRVAGNGEPALAEGFQRVGHAVLRGAVDGPSLRRGELAACGEIARALQDPPEPHVRRQADYITTIQLCERNPALRDIVRSPGLARLAATALGVPRVRLLYDQLFAKPPGSTLTMWHQDEVYWPIDTSEVIEEGTVGVARGWVSLTPLPADVGGLQFVDGSHRLGAIDHTDVQIGAPGGRDTATIDGSEHTITDYGAFGAGDATLHAGYTLHGSRRNTSDRTRYAVAVAYVPDGTRVAEPADDAQALTSAIYAPGRRPGELIDTASNPVLWPREGA